MSHKKDKPLFWVGDPVTLPRYGVDHAKSEREQALRDWVHNIRNLDSGFEYDPHQDFLRVFTGDGDVLLDLNSVAVKVPLERLRRLVEVSEAFARVSRKRIAQYAQGPR